MTRYVIGLGSNLGDRAATLNNAVRRIAALPNVTLLGVSSVYESKAVGPVQPDFLNGAVLVETTVTPRELLTSLLNVEADLGRVRREKWGPRTLDLDILWKDDGPYDDDALHVPHPHLRDRPFALAPLLDVCPTEDWALPRCEQLGGIPRKIGTLSRP